MVRRTRTDDKNADRALDTRKFQLSASFLAPLYVALPEHARQSAAG